MAAVPDFLLKTANSSATSGKAAIKPPLPQERPAAQERFADVFAQERPREAARSEKPRDTSEAKATNQARKDEPARARDDDRAQRTADDDRSADAKPADASAQTDDQPATVAAGDGKTLPADQDKEGKEPGATQLDPLFLLGMTGQFPPPVATPAPTLPVATEAAGPNAKTASQALDPAAILAAATAQGTQGTQAATPGLPGAVLPGAAKPGETATQDDGLAQLLGQVPQQAQGDASKAATSANNLAAQLNTLLPGQAAPVPGAEQAATAALASTLGQGEAKDAALPTKADAFADKLTALSQSLSAPAQTARPVTATVPGQALSPQAGNFSEAVVDKVMWMSSQNLKTADIQMDPPQLGKLEVRIDMTQDQTQVTFASPHADVREALDNGSQRLRELFAQQGMNLSNVNVSDQSSGQAWQQSQQGGQQEGTRRGRGGATGGEDEPLASVAETRGTATLAARSLVDYYA